MALGELASYAAQYRHFEAYVPEFLAQLVLSLPPGPGRDLVAANLADELGDPVPHTELFEHFATAVGAPRSEPSPAMAHLLRAHEDALVEGGEAGLATFLAYECQAADVARAKGEGLRRHYRLDELGARFWDHHGEVDVRHGAWAEAALGALPGDKSRCMTFVRRGADAWWAFLDEREALAA